MHRSTIDDERKRHSGPVGYQPAEAQQRTDARRWVNRKRKMDDTAVGEYIRDRMEEN